MRTLYFDCGMGAAGDMITAALYELIDDKEGFLEEINNLGIPGVEFVAEASVKCGITGTHMSVLVHGEEESSHHHEEHHNEEDHNEEHHNEDHYNEEHHHEENHHHEEHHHHTSMHDIEHIVEKFALSDKVKEDILSVYRLIANAESQVHGVPVTQIHFHEIGNMDAIADVTAACVLMDRINPDRVVASPVHVGSGTVKCAHGILPVPAPATAHILQDIPIYSKDIRGELCTPTGAALLKYFVTDFGDMPVMTLRRTGYGMGKKDFPIANCVRCLLGDTADACNQIVELCCNVDDMTPERIGFAMEILLEAGALDVYTTSIGMKKSRPGVLISVMCREDKREEMINLIFKHTTTLGIRENISRRYTLTRRVETVNTPLGEIRVKRSEGYGVHREKYEYDDLARIARQQGISIEECINMIL